MPEARDPAIKLFGRTIPLLDCQDEEAAVEEPSPPTDDGSNQLKDACGEVTKAEAKDTTTEIKEKPDHDEPDASADLHCGNEDDSHAPKEGETAIHDPSTEQEQNEANGSCQGKVLKKPDKVLPCPRCNSLNTKFCYYNNYNVNQPRHFCKNCQRYWTAGGTMRNVPVGAGRRKNKHSSSHFRHAPMSTDAMPSPGLNTSGSVSSQVAACGLPVATQPLKNNGTVVNFVPEAPICESTASVFGMGDQKRNVEMGTAPCGENGDEPSCASSLTALNGLENELPDNSACVEQNGLQGGCNGLPPIHHVQCYPGPSWAYPWSPVWNGIAPLADGRYASGHESGNTNPVPWNPPPIMAAPAFCAPTIPLPFIPAFFWGCMSSWPNGPWNVPWVGSSCSSPPSAASNSGCPSLGKHCRATSLPGEDETEKSLWVPKTLRIDDPDEAAKSSIWATLGIKPDPTTKKEGIFQGFQHTTAIENHSSDGKQVLHVNPAALSRSRAFQEST